MQLFFGRERKIRQVFKVLKSGSSVALIGEEGMGKSSLLWVICQQAETHLQPPRQPVFLDFNEVDNEDDFYRALCHEVGIPESTCEVVQIPPPANGDLLNLPLPTFRRYLKQVEAQLGTKGLIIVLDEFQKIEDLNQGRPRNL